MLAAPFPYFGGKRRAAPRIWQALGDPAGYVEPFAGSAAVLLARPAFTGRRVETLNDADGWLVNCWRAIQLSPEAVAAAAWGPVAEIDYHARLAWLQQRRTPDLVAWLEGDPEHHDAKAAGWWLYVLACGIGDPFGSGPWRVVDGHLRKLPHLGDAGQGVNRELPHLGDAGKGVNRGLPHLGDAGQGVNRGLPHLGDAGKGQLAAYMHQLADRLQRVRITCGSWERVVKPSVTRSGTGGDGSRALLLDPPYATSGDLYAESSEGVAKAVRTWCLTAPRELRIVLCGYDSEHDALLTYGWSVTEGKAGGGAGYSTNSFNGRRERLWLSPACIGHTQPSLL
ncbi:MAG: DNA adenine methylase [Vulcanococcus sp.]